MLSVTLNITLSYANVINSTGQFYLKSHFFPLHRNSKCVWGKMQINQSLVVSFICLCEKKWLDLLRVDPRLPDLMNACHESACETKDKWQMELKDCSKCPLARGVGCAPQCRKPASDSRVIYESQLCTQRSGASSHLSEWKRKSLCSISCLCLPLSLNIAPLYS